MRRIRQKKSTVGTSLYGSNGAEELIRVTGAFPAIVSQQEFDLAQVMTRNAEDPAQ